jgi:hypothetical protein
MTMLLNFLHIIFLVLAIIFSCYIGYSGTGYYFSGDAESAQAMNVVALITLIFSGRHSYLYMNYGLEIPKLIAFPIIYIALGMTLDIAMGSVIEFWSPATAMIASQLSISIGWILAVLVVAAIVSTEY